MRCELNWSIRNFDADGVLLLIALWDLWPKLLCVTVVRWVALIKLFL